MSHPPLDAVQNLIWKLIRAPEGVEKGLAELTAKGDPAAEQVHKWIVSDDRLSAEGRLDVYANMYFYRLKDVLLEDFPKVAAKLGEERFHNLITDFLLQHPSEHYSLRYLGRPFAAFIAGHSLGGEFPGAADLAALEYALGEAFQAANAPQMERAALADIPQDKWPDVRFTIAPCVQIVQAGCDVDSLWDHPEETAKPAKQTLLVYRLDNQSHREIVPEADVPAVLALAEGRPFAEVCEPLPSEVAAQRAAQIVADWLNAGLISGYRFD